MRSNKVARLGLAVWAAMSCMAAFGADASVDAGDKAKGADKDRPVNFDQAETVGELLVLDSKKSIAAAKKALAQESASAESAKAVSAPVSMGNYPSPNVGAQGGGPYPVPTQAARSPFGDAQLEGVYQLISPGNRVVKAKVSSGGLSTYLTAGASFRGWRVASMSVADGCVSFDRQEEVAVAPPVVGTSKIAVDAIPTVRMETRVQKLCIKDADKGSSISGMYMGGVPSMPTPVPGAVAGRPYSLPGQSAQPFGQ